MILIFGGTTEGRIAVKVCDGASKPFFYSTKNEGQVVEATHITHLCGVMTSSDIIKFCKEREIKVIVDASHPFADVLHKSIMEASTTLGIPLIRYEREALDRSMVDGTRYCKSTEDAVRYIEEKGYQRVLALTGVKSSKALASISKDREIRLRIMDRDESWQLLRESGLSVDDVVVYGQQSDEDIMRSFAPAVVLIKDSGESGGVPQKIMLTQRLGIDLVVIERPSSSSYKTVVYGEHGLRHAIERALPDFFELSTGLTTGSCATAGAVAALHTLLTGEICQSISIQLPSKEHIIMDVANVEFKEGWAKASIIKDAGDDPDITHGAEICAIVEINHCSKDIVIRGGEGVGTVTLPGLELEVGSSAINATPRKMIRENIQNELRRMGCNHGVNITISVPKGAKLAKQTFNERLGIIGGISILGTSGIVYPFSKEAFIESIERHIQMVKALGYDCIAINSGGKSERFLKSHLAEMPSEAFVQYGNMIGDTLRLCQEANISRVVLGVMLGKAVKLADGNLDTHSKSSSMNTGFIAKIAESVGCGSDIIDKIGSITTARELWEIIPKQKYIFFERLKELCHNHCKEVIDSSRLEIVIVRDDGEIF